MKIALFSDLHLDTQFAWAGPEASRRRRQALRDTLARIVDLALEHRVDALCCGGDLFEHHRVAPDTGTFLRNQFARLGHVPVYVAPGNHDWLNPQSLYRRVEWTPNVHIFDGTLRAVAMDDGLTLWGGAHLKPAGSPGFLDGFGVDRDGIHLGLFHGAALGFFAEEGKEPHAPFRAEQIREAGLHFAMLGHYHHPRDEQTFTYPGNPDPLNFGESGLRGVVLLTIAQDGSVSIERHAVAVSKVCDIELDVTGCADKQELIARVASQLGGIDGYARLLVRGDLDTAIDLQPSDIADLPCSLAAKPVIQLRLQHGYDFARLRAEQTVRGQFVRDVEASPLSVEDKGRVLITGLRALDRRTDLEVF